MALSKFVFVWFLFGVCEWGFGEAAQCNKETMRTCKDKIFDLIDQRSRSARKHELDDQCSSIQENFNCFLWQNAMCLTEDEQESNGDVITRTRRFLDGFCEDTGNWWTKACYQRDDIKRCENLLSSRSRSTDNIACHGYVNFRDCVTSIVEDKCNRDERQMLGIFLMDKGQQKAWRCPKDPDIFSSQSTTAPLAYGSRRETGYLSDSSSYQSCIQETITPVRECSNKFDELRKYTEKNVDDKDKRERDICCGFNRYVNCVFKVFREKCGDTQGADNMISAVKSLVSYSCDEKKMATCSASTFTVSLGVMLLLSLILLMLL